MKKTILPVTLIGVLGVLAGCKPSNRVTFKPALISVDPGMDWKRTEIPTAPPVCPPRLTSKVGIINALVLSEEKNIKMAADLLQGSLYNSGKAKPDSFKQEDFTTDSGLSGIHL